MDGVRGLARAPGGPKVGERGAQVRVGDLEPVELPDHRGAVQLVVRLGRDLRVVDRLPVGHGAASSGSAASRRSAY
ncbi:MAG TPA: hypothetical protein VEV65_00190, partial [Kineosporiaceae bacterium]|nr:hypothetical protein [Kineosporiaceae bacterium]